MFNIGRILRALRLYVAELPASRYVTAPLVLLGLVIVVVLVVNFEDGSTDSVLEAAYVEWDAEILTTMLVGATFASLLIVGMGTLTKFFKEDERRLRTFSLPLSPAERTLSLLLLVGVYLPLVVAGTMTLGLSLLYVVAPAHYILGPFEQVLPTIFLAYLSYLAVLIFFSSIIVTSPKHGGWAVVISLMLIPAYAYGKYTLTGDPRLFPESPHDGPEYVGLPISGNTENGIPEWFSSYLDGTVLSVGIWLSAICLLAAFYFALRYRQT